jgi:hypothetical protein
MIEECGMIWLSHVENCVFVAVIPECVQTAICQALFVCGLTVQLALKVARVQLVNVVA